MAKVELIVNSRTLTVETLNDANSHTPISPNNILTSYIVMTPPGEFSQPDVYSKNDGDVFNTLKKNFGLGGEKNFFRPYNADKNGKSKSQVFCCRYITVEGQMSAKLVANHKNCQYQN